MPVAANKPFTVLARGCIGNAPGTVKMYVERGSHVARLIGDLDVNHLHVDDVQSYIQRRLDEGAARETVRKELCALRRSLTIAKERGMMHGDARACIPTFRVRYVPRKRYLTHSEFKALAAELTPPRQLWLMLAVFTGGRDGEVDGLCWHHVDFEQRLILIAGTKTERSERVVPLHPMLAAVLESQSNRSGHIAGEWLNARRDLARACKRAGIERVSPNDLRRTFASWLKQQGVDSYVVAQLLGHTTARMVELVYGRLDRLTLSKAMAKLTDGATDRDKYVPDRNGPAGPNGRTERKPRPKPPSVREVQRVLGPGIEPGTRGFSIRCSTS